MNTIRIAVSATLICGLLASAGIALSPSFADDQRGSRSTSASGERQWLSIRQVHDLLEAAGYRNIEKIEREHGVYEVRATDSAGMRVKRYVNPQTGSITGREGGDRKRDRDAGNYSDSGSERPAGKSISRECNERRCRDDMPAPVPKR
ncbi:MAG: PepSY domain-containing protein [Zoogloeaceae bacterium]|nr:PepSY domain-containing protein [Zoogloeaceae bacterium]